MSANIVVVQGRLTDDIELKTLETGTVLTNFSIAQNHYVKKGEPEKVSFFRVTAFSHSAKFLNDYTSKGDEVLVTGELQQRRWTADDGTKREQTSIYARQVNLLRKKGAKSEQADNDEIPSNPFSDSEIPF